MKNIKEKNTYLKHLYFRLGGQVEIPVRGEPSVFELTGHTEARMVQYAMAD